MVISTQTSYFGQEFGEKEAVRMICEAGFDAIDYSMLYMNDAVCPTHGIGWEKHVRELKNIADGYGKFFNQTHAPFPIYTDGDEAKNKLMFDYTVRAIEATAIVGAEHTVVHPALAEKDQFEKNLEIYNSLLPYCKEFGVKVSIENYYGSGNEDMWGHPENFIRLLDGLDKNYFCALLDVGHAELSAVKSVEFIYGLGADRLKGLHIHENDYAADRHTIPYFYGTFDWKAIMGALREIGYTGDLTFEADKFLRLFPREIALDGSKLMYAVGKRLKAIFDEG